MFDMSCLSRQTVVKFSWYLLVQTVDDGMKPGADDTDDIGNSRGTSSSSSLQSSRKVLEKFQKCPCLVVTHTSNACCEANI